MKIKLDSKMSAPAADVLSALARQLYDRRGRRIVGVVELTHDRRTQPAPDSEKEPEVTMRVTALEVGREEQEHHLREAMRALHLHRTANGTLDEANEVQLSDRTIELTAGVMHAVEAARLRAVVQHWSAYARQVTNTGKPLSITELRHELSTLADGLHAAIYGITDPDD